jgi:hypothetical protein
MYLIRPAQGTQFEVTCEKPQLVPCWHLTYSPVLDGVDLEVRNLAYRPGWNLCLCCRLSQLLRVATFCYVVIVLKGPYQLGHTPGSALNILDQRNLAIKAQSISDYTRMGWNPLTWDSDLAPSSRVENPLLASAERNVRRLYRICAVFYLST